MSGEKEIIDLVQLYDLFKSPAFVKSHGQVIEDDKRRKVYTVKKTISTPGLGNIVLGSAYCSTQKGAIPIVFLSEEQMKILRKCRIRFIVKKKQNPTNDEAYIGFPSRQAFERMVTI